MEKLSIGIIGYGNRGKVLTESIFIPMAETDIKITAVCDKYEDRASEAAQFICEHTDRKPFCTTNYKELIGLQELDVVIILSAWDSHIPIAVAAMKAGKEVAMEVGGTYTIRDCWDLIRTSEQTGKSCSMLENCCFGRREMMVMNMVRKGFLGEIVHCSGGYCHDLREEIANGRENRHYRLQNYMLRNCENYPTHELGPILKILDINRGNRFMTLTSTSSASKGLHEYIVNNKGSQDPLAQIRFAQGDIVTTVIRCAGGQTVTITLDTTLPRYYSRGFTVRGTKGSYTEDTDSCFIDGVHNSYDFDWKSQWGNAKEFEAEYDHPLWKEYQKEIRGGHEGMDWLVFKSCFDSIKNGSRPVLDIYDIAVLMSISTLSEQSISLGGMPVSIPDFTSGRWMNNTQDSEEWARPDIIAFKNPIG